MKLALKFLCTLSLMMLSQMFFPQSLDLQLYTSGLDRPVNIQHEGDRLFVIELDGLIKIIESDGTLVAQPFLDIDDRVRNINGLSEQGLLGLAFHPNYATNGLFYVNYINNNGNTVISRFNRSTNNIADPNSELIILTYNQPFSNHNGGCLAFGADGYLYISSGDGGSGGDPQDNGQDLSNLLGKILRIDVDNTDTGLNYGIPSDNPFVSNTSARDEIWSYGLRNPWKFSFDRLNADLWIGDVGQDNKEEINLIASNESGINFGWRCYEGNSTFNLTDCPPSNELRFPVSEYAQSGTSRCSVTGGYRYRGSEFPALEGTYFFADYCSGEIGTLKFNGSTWDMEFNSLISGQNWSSFGENLQGEIFIASATTGNIYKIVDNNVLNLEEINNYNFKISPNPSSDFLHISAPDFSRIKIDIIDISGRLVYANRLSLPNNEATINVRNLSKGVYFLRISTNQTQEYVFKFLKN